MTGRPRSGRGGGLNKVFRGYVRQQTLTWLSQKGWAFTLTSQHLVTPLMGLAIWTTALGRSRTIATYFAALLLVRLVVASYEQHTFSEGIYQGTIVDQLLRPHAMFVPTLAENIAIRIAHVVLGFPAVVLAVIVAPVRPSGRDVLLALPALAGAALVRFLFTYSLAMTAFWTTRVHGLMAFASSLIFLLGGEAVPVPVLRGTWRTVAEALPFRAMHGFPAEIASGWLSPAQIATGYAWQAFWATAALATCAVLTRTGVRHYTAFGA